MARARLCLMAHDVFREQLQGRGGGSISRNNALCKYASLGFELVRRYVYVLVQRHRRGIAPGTFRSGGLMRILRFHGREEPAEGRRRRRRWHNCFSISTELMLLAHSQPACMEMLALLIVWLYIDLDKATTGRG